MADLEYIPGLDELFRDKELFCETGCKHGEGLRVAADHVPHLLSCDINADMVASTRQALTDPHNGILYVAHCDSLSFLDWYCRVFCGPTLFWLDAHWPAHYGVKYAGERLQFPLLEEVRVVARNKLGFERDVILCDDISNIADEQNPYWQKYRGNAACKFAYDGFRLHDLVQELESTHNVRFHDDGYSPVLIAEPRT